MNTPTKLSIGLLFIVIISIGLHKKDDDGYPEGPDDVVKTSIHEPRFLVKDRHSVADSTSIPKLGSKSSPPVNWEVNESAFHTWAEDWVENQDPHSMAAGIKHATERANAMEHLIEHAPDDALSAMLPLEYYVDLPNEVLAVIEKPFSESTRVEVLPNCSKNGGPNAFYHLYLNSGRVAAYLAGTRGEGLVSKSHFPAAGVELNGKAAVSERRVWTFDADEVKNAAMLFDVAPPEEMPSADVALVNNQFVVASEKQKTAIEDLYTVSESLPGPGTSEVITYFLASDGGIQNLNNESVYDELLQDLVRASQSWTLTPKKILFMNLRFADGSEYGDSTSNIQNRLDQCDSQLEDSSYGQTSFSVKDVYSFALPGAVADYYDGSNFLYSDLYNDAIELAFQANLISGTSYSEYTTDYDIVGVVFPYQSVGWAGRAGGSSHWINGIGSFGTYIHEFGHNYGLAHASEWNEQDPAEIPPYPVTSTHLSNDSDIESRHVEYGDEFAFMGSSFSPNEFTMFSKTRLWWIDDSNYLDLAGNTQIDQTVRIYRSDHVSDTSGSNPLAVRVQMQDSETFWLGYRGSHFNSYAQDGLNVLWQISTSRARLLDMTPATTSIYDKMLPVGQSYTDTSSLITITPLQKGGSDGSEWIDVKIIRGVVGNENPTVNVGVNDSTPEVLETMSFTATGSDPDNDSLIYNWDFGDGNTRAGAGASQSYQYLVGGSYEVKVSVVDGRGGYAEDSVMVTVNDPLSTMTAASLDVTRSFYDISYYKGRYYAVATSGYFYTSFDGNEWTEETGQMFGYDGLYGIESDASGLIVCGADWNGTDYDSVIYEKSHGGQWEEASLPSGTKNRLNAVVRANGVSVTVGDEGVILYNNGSGWAAASSGVTTSLDDVVYGGGRFVAVGEDKTILSSINGQSWSNESPLEFGSSYYDYLSIVHRQDQYFLGGAYGSLGAGMLNGTWNEADGFSTTFGAGAGVPGRVVFFDDSYDSAISRYKVTTMAATVDGTEWGGMPITTTMSVNATVYGAGRLVTVGDSGEIFYSGSFEPTNQDPVGMLAIPSAVAARTDVNIAANVTDPDGDSLCYYWDMGEGNWELGNATMPMEFLVGGVREIKLRVVDGRGGSLQASQTINISDPLLTFNDHSGQTTSYLSDVACLDGLVLAASSTRMLYGDGSLENLPTSYYYPFYNYGIAAGVDELMMVGRLYDSSTGTSSSAIRRVLPGDPGTLLVESVPSGAEQLNGVAYGNNTWVAVGSDGKILSKTGSGSWISRTSGTSENLNDISYGQGIFMAVGSEGTILVSANGASWSPAGSSPSATTDWGTVDFTGIGFCLGSVNYYTNMYFSNDQGNTWHRSGPGNTVLYGAVWTGEFIFAIGLVYDFGVGASTAHHFVSRDGIHWEWAAVSGSAGVRSVGICGDEIILVGSSGFLQSQSVVAPSTIEITGSEYHSNRFSIRFMTEAGKSYRIATSVDLNGWSAVSGQTGISGTGGEVTRDNLFHSALPPVNGRRFFRIEEE